MGKDKTELFQIAEKFYIGGVKQDVVPHGSGHINDTFLLTCREEGEERRYILQRMNHEIRSEEASCRERVSKSV